MIPDDGCLNSRSSHVNKIEIDELFGGVKIKTVDVFSEDFNLDKSSQKRDHKKPLEISIPQSETDPSTLFKSLEEVPISPQSVRKWFLIFTNYANFGPYTSEEIYVFLKNFARKTENIKQEKEHPRFLVADCEADIYFQPFTLLEILEEDIKEKIQALNLKKDSDIEKQKVKFIERKFSEHPKMITKYDVAEMNSKFKHAQYLPIKQLKLQLKELKINNENNSNTMNTMNTTRNIDINKTPRNNNFNNKFNNKFNFPNSQDQKIPHTTKHNFSNNYVSFQNKNKSTISNIKNEKLTDMSVNKLFEI